MTSKTNTEQTTTEITYRGVRLARKIEAGPRGGHHYIYQAAIASRVWGCWYDSAAQAARESNASDRVCSGI